MRSFGTRWVREDSLLAEFSDHMGGAVMRHKANVALSAAKVEAELASKAKSEFIANMSHELRTPLNAIIGFSDMLYTMEISDRERVSQYSEYIKQAAEHLLELINGILDVSKIQAGNLIIERSNVALADLVDTCLTILEAKAKEKNITISSDIADDLSDIHADPLRIKQVLINLLSNAVKFTPANGQVRLQARMKSDSCVQIIVADNGIGMSPQEIDMSLRPFGQVQRGFDKGHEGTGLGLPICFALVQMHGGSIRVDSQKGHGTQVVVDLPVSETLTQVAVSPDIAAETPNNNISASQH